MVVAFQPVHFGQLLVYLNGVHPRTAAVVHGSSYHFCVEYFSNLHLIQKCIHNQQLLLNQMSIGKNNRHKDDKMKSLYLLFCFT